MAKASGGTRTKGSGGGFDSQVSSWEKSTNRDLERMTSSSSDDLHKTYNKLTDYVSDSFFKMSDRAGAYYEKKRREYLAKGEEKLYDATVEKGIQTQIRISAISQKLHNKKDELIEQLRSKRK